MHWIWSVFFLIFFCREITEEWRTFKALTKQEEPKRLLGCSKNWWFFFLNSCLLCFSREKEFSVLPSKTKVTNENKEILGSFLFCMYLGSFTLPLHKGKWVQLNGKTLQALKNSLNEKASGKRRQFKKTHPFLEHPNNRFGPSCFVRTWIPWG